MRVTPLQSSTWLGPISGIVALRVSNISAEFHAFITNTKARAFFGSITAGLIGTETLI